MCRYNISVTLKRSQYHQKFFIGKQIKTNLHELLLFTIVINSYSFTETPNIVIPVFQDEEQQVAQLPMVATQIKGEEMRTSKFKEFKAHVQELKYPSKVSLLKKITLAFFVLLIGVFSLNYGICVGQNQKFNESLEIINILYTLKNKVPSTARYARTVLNIANGIEPGKNDVLSGISLWENRYTYYMRLITENVQSFSNIQQQIYTKYQSQLQFDSSSISTIVQVSLFDLQTDYSINLINTTLSSGLNLYLSKVLKLAQLKPSDLQNVIVPFLDFRFDKSQKSMSHLQQDMYFIIRNGQESIPFVLDNIYDWYQGQIESQSQQSFILSLGIAIASMIAIVLVVVPLTYPLLTHYELLAAIILHALNKLTRSFVENEVKCTNQLYDYISRKTASENASKAAEKKANDEDFADSMFALKRKQTRRKKNRVKKSTFITASDLTRTINIEASNSFMEEDDISDTFSQINLVKTSNQGPAFKRMERRGHMPPILRKASYYEKIEEFPQFDSFGEDDSHSNNSSQSNYTHQEYNTVQLQAIKEMGLLDPNKDDGVALNGMFNLSNAKSSESAKEPNYFKDSTEENNLKKLSKHRKQIIITSMKSKKIRKLVSLSIFVFAISIYLALNTVYTHIIFQQQQFLHSNIQIIDKRMLCYPFSLTVIKEMISRGQNNPGLLQYTVNSDEGSSQIGMCHKSEQAFNDIIFQNNHHINRINALSFKYLTIFNSLESNKLCQTLQLNYPNEIPNYIGNFCLNVSSGLINIGFHEVLNYILLDQENIILNFKLALLTEPKQKALSQLFTNSSISTQEMIMDVFLSSAFDFQRTSFIKEIKTYGQFLYGVFDILFGVFVAALCVATIFVGFFYLSNNLQRRIVQIYHVVMLIPYGERTMRELNELIKIDL